MEVYAYYITNKLLQLTKREKTFYVDLYCSILGQVKRDAPEFQQILGEILIILAPIAPHMMSELWQSYTSVNNKLYSDFQWDKGVFHQTWPELESNHNMDLLIKCNNSKVANIQVKI